ncbi:EAL domain-containing protein [Christensenellaceae bacterium OttesenSCG-928-M15]|nr:EAL domain-containing protein [Christensenellaceae bacterium OttesenSCG-928-M15]
MSNRFHALALLEELVTANRKKLAHISVFYLDLDRFKYINDTWGHRTGDSFIAALAERLQKDFCNEVIIARMSGDEFLIVAENLQEPVERQFFADRIFKSFERPFEFSHRTLQMSASVGSSTFPEDGRDAESLIKNAEIAMYRAKELGIGLYVPYQVELHNAMKQKIYIENKLRSSVNSGCQEFCAYFQPKLDVLTGEITSCEALMRWNSPEGMINPMEFIPQAEESGLIVPLSWWMIRECCRQCREFEKQGVDCSVAINVSAQVLLHNDFLPVLRSAVETAGIDYAKLDIEIVEQTLVEDIVKVNEVITTLHALGVEISVDDFGTGYSSLSYLNKMAVDRIKIDRSFVMTIGNSAENQAIINAIIAMSKSLHMVITAEGVETREQYDFLKEANCEEIQGYLISKPMPAQEYIKFVKQWTPASIDAAE